MQADSESNAVWSLATRDRFDGFGMIEKPFDPVIIVFYSDHGFLEVTQS
jgi:hypothetical protein